MNEIDWLKSLDRGADAMSVDVAASVMRGIRRREAQTTEDSLAMPALIATVTAALALMIALQLGVTNPFADMLESFNLVLQ